MTNLTEQWKKGELPLGHYYVVCSKNDTVEILQNRVQILSCSKVGITYDFPDYWEVKQVLAEVPSYDEWFKIKNLAALSECLQEKNIECLHRENRVKELLKRAKEILEDEGDYMIVQEIDQVLQENK